MGSGSLRTANKPAAASTARRVAAIGEAHITSFILVMAALFHVACIVGWLKGGRPERFGVAVLVLHALVHETHRAWRVGHIDAQVDQAVLAALADEQAVWRIVLTLCFGWLAFRSPRWWPLAALATLILILLVHLLTIVTPIPHNAAASARVGLWMILYLILLAGVAERWLAGEAPVSRIGRGAPGRGQRSSGLGNDQMERPA